MKDLHIIFVEKRVQTSVTCCMLLTVCIQCMVELAQMLLTKAFSIAPSPWLCAAMID